MRILGLDIGAGTKDILLYDSEKSIENCIKMVIPSPSSLYGRQIEEAGVDLYINGYTIGGGELGERLRLHMSKGFRVYMGEEAAFSLYSDLSRVKGLGIAVGEPPKAFRGERIHFDEVDIQWLDRLFRDFMESLGEVEAVAVALQDHGASPPGVGQNKFRMNCLKEHLARDPEITRLLFPENLVPAQYLRMRSAARSVKSALPRAKIFMMDSTIAAIMGCLFDNPKDQMGRPVVVLNVGNSHTTAALLDERVVIGLVEHHTSVVRPNRLRSLIQELKSGTVSDSEVVEEGGHGAFCLTEPPKGVAERALVTGPKRALAMEAGLKVHFSAPTGDVMMTGVFGMVKAVEERLR